MGPDSTNVLIEEFRTSPAKWRPTFGVPLFKAHTRTLPDGTEVKVTDKDLSRIADEVNRTTQQTGRLPTFTLGHRKFGVVNESDQPELLGFHLNFRAETIKRPDGEFLALVADEYAAADEADRHKLYRKFPFRSAEYHPAAGYKGAAALQQPPWLDMGTVYHYGADARLVTYQTDPIPMNEAAPSAVPAPDATNAATTAAPESEAWTPDDDAAYAVFSKYMAKYEAAKAAPAAAGATNAAPPKPVKAEPDGDEPKKETPMSQYQATGVDATVAALQKQVAALEADKVKATCQRLLDPLVGYYQFDAAREISLMTAYQSDAERESHAKYIAANNARLPGGAMIPLYQGETRPQGMPACGSPSFDPMMISPALHETIKAYAAEHAMTYGEATEAVARKAAK